LGAAVEGEVFEHLSKILAEPAGEPLFLGVADKGLLGNIVIADRFSEVARYHDGDLRHAEGFGSGDGIGLSALFRAVGEGSEGDGSHVAGVHKGNPAIAQGKRQVLLV